MRVGLGAMGARAGVRRSRRVWLVAGARVSRRSRGVGPRLPVAASAGQRLRAADRGPRRRRRRRSAPRSGRRCFTPQATRAAYNVGPLYASGFDGRGMTIADRRLLRQRHDGARPARLRPGVRAAADVRRGGRDLHAGHADVQRAARCRARRRPRRRRPRATAPARRTSRAWALEVALDVETAHAIAPGREHPARHDADGRDARRAGLPADDERRAVRRRPPPGRRHLAELRLGRGGVRQRAVAAEPARTRSSPRPRNGVTVLASSGDGGTRQRPARRRSARAARRSRSRPSGGRRPTRS